MGEKIVVGQTLFLLTGSRQRGLREVNATVTKVGRRWLSLDPAYFGRVDADTLRFEDSTSDEGRAYLSREHFVAEQRADKAWSEFHGRVHAKWSRPTGLTSTAIEQATALLFASPSTVKERT